MDSGFVGLIFSTFNEVRLHPADLLHWCCGWSRVSVMDLEVVSAHSIGGHVIRRIRARWRTACR